MIFAELSDYILGIACYTVILKCDIIRLCNDIYSVRCGVGYHSGKATSMPLKYWNYDHP